MGDYKCPKCLQYVVEEGDDEKVTYRCPKCNTTIPERELHLDRTGGPETNPHILGAVKESLKIIKTHLGRYDDFKLIRNFEVLFDADTRWSEVELWDVFRRIYNVGYRRGKEGLEPD